MALSKRPAARARQVANLIPGAKPPAEPGNRLTFKHGARATPKTLPVEPKVQAIYAALAEEAPLRAPDGGLPPADRTVVELLALSLARIESVAAYLAAFGPLDERTGEVRPAAEFERRLRAEARDHAESLGMTPGSRVRLGIDVQRAYDFAQALAEDYHREQARAIDAEAEGGEEGS